jgi:hypothetical protein
LENSSQRYSIFNLVRDLYGKYPSGFSRRDLVSLVNGYTRKNSEAFLHNLFDSVGPISLDSLNRTYSALKQMGRFSPGVQAESNGKSKIIANESGTTWVSTKTSASAGSNAKLEVEFSGRWEKR